MRARRLLGALLVAGALLALAGCGASNSAASASISTKTYPAGKRPVAPDVTGTKLDDGTFRLADERGTVVVMNFWGSWCAPCRVEAADLETVSKSGSAAFIGVDMQDTADAAKSFVTAHGLTYPSIFDPAGHVALAFRNLPSLTPPYTVVIDATGHIASVHIGPVTTAELTSMIKAAQA